MHTGRTGSPFLKEENSWFPRTVNALWQLQACQLPRLAARIRPTSVESAKTERIVIRAFHDFADYLRTLPLHESQQELGGDDNSTLFEYHIKPTFDFYQLALAQGDQMEVLEPESVRSKMHRLLANMMQLYR